MRLVFIHGMRQEGKVPEELRDAWETALLAAWSRAGLLKPTYELEMPFYGDMLNELTEAVRGKASAVVVRGEGDSNKVLLRSGSSTTKSTPKTKHL